jgi:3-methylcrotonyl-CoA carboxylase beta subunit
MWPNARISVMGGEQAADVLVQVKQAQLAKQNEQLSPKQINELKAPIIAKYEAQGHPYYASARLWDDAVIDPKDTRNVLIMALHTCAHAPDTYQSDMPQYGVYRM